jgi:hypothetical protein
MASRRKTKGLTALIQQFHARSEAVEWIAQPKRIGLLLLTEQRVKENSLRKRPDREPIAGLRLAAGDDRLPGIQVVLPPGRHGGRIEARVLGHPVFLQLLQQLCETTHPATPEVDGVQSGQFNRRFVRREISQRKLLPLSDSTQQPDSRL